MKGSCERVMKGATGILCGLGVARLIVSKRERADHEVLAMPGSKPMRVPALPQGFLNAPNIGLGFRHHRF